MNLFSKSGIIFRIVSIGMVMATVAFGSEAAAASHAAAKGAECDFGRGPCSAASSDGLRVELDIRPKPVKAMSDLTFIVTLSRDGAPPITDASVSLDLSMPGMFMGKNRPLLKPASEGRYEGKGVITRCPSGRKTWQARVTIEQDGKTTAADFVFEVN